MSLQVSPSTATPFMPITNAAEKNAEDPRNTITRHDTLSLSQAAQEAGCAPISFVDADITPGAGKELLSLHETDTLQATSAAGTQVLVTRKRTEDALPAWDKTTPAGENQAAEAAAYYSMQFIQANGSSLDIEFRDNIRIRESSETGTAVYFTETDITRTYGSDGSVTETAGNIIEEDASSIFVNTRSEELRTGNGDNLIFNWADNANIFTGNGNDTIILRDNATGNTIHTGDGDDTVIGLQITNSRISLGEGNNTFQTVGMENSSITAGNGDNTISVKLESNKPYYKGAGDVDNSSIIVGDGDNSLTLGAIQEHSSVVSGNGNNTLVSGQLNTYSSIIMGNGDNKLDIYSVGERKVSPLLAGISAPNIESLKENSALEGSARIDLGNGNNTLSTYRIGSEGTIQMGDGQNKTTIYEIEGNGSLTLGNGNNLFSTYTVNEDGVLNFGNGDNTINMYEIKNNGNVSIGNGNNSIRTYRSDNHSSLTIGDGSNALRMFEINNFSSVSLGNGNNNVSVNIMNNQANLNMGDGDNIFSVDIMRNSSHIGTGNGNNLGFIGSMYYNSTITGTKYYFIPFLSEHEHNKVTSQYKEAVEERKQQGIPVAGSSLQDMKEISENKYMDIIKEQRYQLYPQLGQSSLLKQNLDFSWQTSDLWADMMNTFDYGWSDLHLDHYV